MCQQSQARESEIIVCSATANLISLPVVEHESLSGDLPPCTSRRAMVVLLFIYHNLGLMSSSFISLPKGTVPLNVLPPVYTGFHDP